MHTAATMHGALGESKDRHDLVEEILQILGLAADDCLSTEQDFDPFLEHLQRVDTGAKESQPAYTDGDLCSLEWLEGALAILSAPDSRKETAWATVKKFQWGCPGGV